MDLYQSQNTFRLLRPSFPARIFQNLKTVSGSTLIRFRKILTQKLSDLKTRKYFAVGIFAHGGEVHELAIEEVSLITALTHQPTWLSLLIIIFVLFGIYALLEKLKVKPLNRVLALIPFTILIAILYLSHNPTVTTVVLVVGFVTTFILAFTLMRSPRGDDKTDKPDQPEA